MTQLAELSRIHGLPPCGLEDGTSDRQREGVVPIVSKQDTASAAALNDYIRNIRQTPTWNRLVVKYFGGGAVDILRLARR
jgi:hypothetical protein